MLRGIKRIEVNDLMQEGYSYLLTEPVGKNCIPISDLN